MDNQLGLYNEKWTQLQELRQEEKQKDRKNMSSSKMQQKNTTKSRIFKKDKD